MSYKNVFKRSELKYLLTPDDKAAILLAMRDHMRLDNYGRTTIRNLYYDDDSFRLIRRSIEKPAYKEKLRVRSYRQVDGDGEVFVELKKMKNDGLTVIFISHRLSTTVNADRIYVMENGRIIESGSHQELMELGGTYAYMFNLQAEKYKN